MPTRIHIGWQQRAWWHFTLSTLPVWKHSMSTKLSGPLRADRRLIVGPWNSACTYLFHFWVRKNGMNKIGPPSPVRGSWCFRTNFNHTCLMKSISIQKRRSLIGPDRRKCNWWTYMDHNRTYPKNVVQNFKSELDHWRSDRNSGPRMWSNRLYQISVPVRFTYDRSLYREFLRYSF